MTLHHGKSHYLGIPTPEMRPASGAAAALLSASRRGGVSFAVRASVAVSPCSKQRAQAGAWEGGIDLASSRCLHPSGAFATGRRALASGKDHRNNDFAFPISRAKKGDNPREFYLEQVSCSSFL